MMQDKNPFYEPPRPKRTLSPRYYTDPEYRKKVDALINGLKLMKEATDERRRSRQPW